MSKIIKSKTKIYRSIGVAYSSKSKSADYSMRRPGAHGSKPIRLTEYGRQLKEKKKLFASYNVSNRYLSNSVEKSKKSSGSATNNLCSFLERRLDIIVYRSNFARTIYSACQLVSHSHIMVNGKVVNIKSYLVKDGDVISVRSKSRDLFTVQDAKSAKKHKTPVYIDLLEDQYSVKFIRDPEVSEIPYEFDIDLRMVIKFYSR
jgi:small subunit ribosomal protein S4